MTVPRVDTRRAEAHDADRTNVRGVLAVMGGLALLLAGAMWGLAVFLEAKPGPVGAEVSGVAPMAGWLESRRELAWYRARERGRLDEYGWVDRERGVVRVPIERAMEMLVERRGAEAGREPAEGATEEGGAR